MGAKNGVLASQWSKLANMSMRHGSSVVGGPTLAQQKLDIGTREIVGYGANGEVTYIDSVMAPTGEGKSILGCVLVAVSVGIWGYFWMKSVVYGALPDTITSDEKQKAPIDRMIAIRANPVEGISSNYDYEKGQWKK